MSHPNHPASGPSTGAVILITLASLAVCAALVSFLLFLWMFFGMS